MPESSILPDLMAVIADRKANPPAERSRPLTVRRLYRDALRDLLPRVRRKLVLTPDEPVDLSLMGAEKP